MSNLMHDILASYANVGLALTKIKTHSFEILELHAQRTDLLAALTKIKTHSRDAAIRQIAANAIAKAES